MSSFADNCLNLHWTLPNCSYTNCLNPKKTFNLSLRIVDSNSSSNFHKWTFCSIECREKAFQEIKDKELVPNSKTELLFGENSKFSIPASQCKFNEKAVEKYEEKLGLKTPQTKQAKVNLLLRKRLENKKIRKIYNFRNPKSNKRLALTVVEKVLEGHFDTPQLQKKMKQIEKEIMKRPLVGNQKTTSLWKNNEFDQYFAQYYPENGSDMKQQLSLLLKQF